MKWLIVGANGQLGRSFCDLLSSVGIPFITLTREMGDISDTGFLNNFFKESDPSVILNCAAWTDVEGAEIFEGQAHLINAQAVESLSQAAKKINAVFVHFSTDYVFGGSRSIPWQENSPHSPLSSYGRSKAQGESLALSMYPEKTYIIRTAWLYSKYGTNFVKTISELAIVNESQLRIVNDQSGQPTSCTDLAKTVLEVVTKKTRYGVYHITNSGQTTWFDFAVEIFKSINADVNRLIPINSSELLGRAIRPSYSILDNSGLIKNKISTLRDWKYALYDELPFIISTIRSEHE